MTKSKYPQSPLVYEQWVKDVIEEQEKLNTWELKFIADIEIRLNRQIPLTEAQAEKLEQIYADKTS